jgi:hypothetical protein
MILILLSVAAFMLGLMFSAFYDKAEATATIGMRFAYCGPVCVLVLVAILVRPLLSDRSKEPLFPPDSP